MKPEEIRSRLRATGRSQAALGRHIGASKDSISRLMNGERRLQATELELIKDFFAGEQPPAGPAYDTLDVYGYAQAGGDDLVSLADGQVIDRIEVPAGLVRGATIGIRVVGDSMEPRLFSGETVIVGLNMPPQRDRDCVVEFRDGSAIVKQYKGQRDGTVFLHQYNPDKEVRVEASKVKAIHAVLYRR
ncbi:S24 family peptidase [Brevundimonas sp. BAL3]|uniref:LexA family transcriptional regulator n=1 Tax=Brevundimonas sp. BAL3 TaxID=391600 RepID=UPI000591109F